MSVGPTYFCILRSLKGEAAEEYPKKNESSDLTLSEHLNRLMIYHLRWSIRPLTPEQQPSSLTEDSRAISIPSWNFCFGHRR
jgi:hypothetical protein